MKFYLRAEEVRSYMIVVEAEDIETVEKYVHENEDQIISSLKEHSVIRDFGEVWVEECEETVPFDFVI